MTDQETDNLIRNRENTVSQAKQFGRNQFEHYLLLQKIDPLHVSELIANRDCDDVYKKDEILVAKCKQGIQEKKERGT